jgi:radical SAM protein with 4Fe4S-binding SPASM domain
MHCGSRAGKKNENELTLNECLDIAQQLIDMNCKQITLIGGEIFLRKDWHKIARKFVDADVYTNIITNALNLQQKHFDALAKSGIQQVGISIDGMEDSHNKIRRHPKSFYHVLQTIQKLKSDQYSIGIVTTLNRLNINDLENMYQLFVDHDIQVWQLQLTSPMGNAENHLYLLLSNEEIKQVIRFIKQKNKDKKMLLVAGDNIGYYTEDEMYIRGPKFHPQINNRFTGCKAGLFVVGIDNEGNVRGCESLMSEEFIEGNLRKNTLEEIWNKKDAFAYNRNFRKELLAGKCADCDKSEVCKGGCRQLNCFTTGNKHESLFCCYAQ